MESTGKYWIPIFNILEKTCQIMLANPKYVKAISGKKTIKMIHVEFLTYVNMIQFREAIFRQKKFECFEIYADTKISLSAIAPAKKKCVQNSLTVSNIALATVVSDTFGKTASKIIDYILSYERFDVEHCKTLISRRMKASPNEMIKSILGYNLSLAQASKIKIAKEHLDSVDKYLDHLHKSVTELAKPYESQIKILLSMTSIKEKSAIKIIAETGVDMSVFKTSKHLCSWAGLRTCLISI